ncbi:MAG TPA: hypothetical protein VJG49_04605 [Candidatus Nanoarchaeia archaeon]|nr:hypothetical protein [Candidatus Nanoarchaeia archaeon]
MAKLIKKKEKITIKGLWSSSYAKMWPFLVAACAAYDVRLTFLLHRELEANQTAGDHECNSHQAHYFF